MKMLLTIVAVCFVLTAAQSTRAEEESSWLDHTGIVFVSEPSEGEVPTKVTEEQLIIIKLSDMGAVSDLKELKVDFDEKVIEPIGSISSDQLADTLGHRITSGGAYRLLIFEADGETNATEIRVSFKPTNGPRVENTYKFSINSDD